MKTAFLSLVAAAALAVSAGSADARPPAYRGVNHSYYGNYHRGSTGGYRGNYYRPYYSNYYGGYGYNSGFGLTIGTGGVYPAFGYNNGYYYSPQYRRWGYRW